MPQAWSKNEFPSKFPCRCDICGEGIGEGDKTKIRKNDNDKWERAHPRCVLSDVPPTTPPAPLTPNSDGYKFADVMRSQAYVKETRKECGTEITPEAAHYLEDIDIQAHLHPDQELREQWKERRLYYEAESLYLKNMSEAMVTTQVNLTSATNRMAAAMEELLKVLKQMHDIQMKFSQK